MCRFRCPRPPQWTERSSERHTRTFVAISPTQNGQFSNSIRPKSSVREKVPASMTSSPNLPTRSELSAIFAFKWAMRCRRGWSFCSLHGSDRWWASCKGQKCQPISLSLKKSLVWVAIVGCEIHCSLRAVIFISLYPLFSPQNFAVELQIESDAEMDIDLIKETLQKAGGANYGTGVREI